MLISTRNIFLTALLLLCTYCSNPGRDYIPGEYEKLKSADSKIEYINSLSKDSKITFFKEVLSKKCYFNPPSTDIKFQSDGKMFIIYYGGGKPTEYFICRWTVKDKTIVLSRPSETKKLPYNDESYFIGKWDNLEAEKFNPDDNESEITIKLVESGLFSDKILYLTAYDNIPDFKRGHNIKEMSE
jgi:hypothetical protein